MKKKMGGVFEENTQKNSSHSGLDLELLLLWQKIAMLPKTRKGKAEAKIFKFIPIIPINKISSSNKASEPIPKYVNNRLGFFWKRVIKRSSCPKTGITVKG